MEVKFYDLNKFKDADYTRVVAVSRFNGKFVFVRQKGKDTFEIPGGHIESGETWKQAIERELFEETGATKIKSIEAISAYTISSPALLCYVEIEEIGNLPNFEIEEVAYFSNLPEKLTYPDTHTKMFNLVKSVKNL